MFEELDLPVHCKATAVLLSTQFELPSSGYYYKPDENGAKDLHHHQRFCIVFASFSPIHTIAFLKTVKQSRARHFHYQCSNNGYFCALLDRVSCGINETYNAPFCYKVYRYSLGVLYVKKM